MCYRITGNYRLQCLLGMLDNQLLSLSDTFCSLYLSVRSLKISSTISFCFCFCFFFFSLATNCFICWNHTSTGRVSGLQLHFPDTASLSLPFASIEPAWLPRRLACLNKLQQSKPRLRKNPHQAVLRQKVAKLLGVTLSPRYVLQRPSLEGRCLHVIFM